MLEAHLRLAWLVQVVHCAISLRIQLLHVQMSITSCSHFKDAEGGGDHRQCKLSERLFSLFSRYRLTRHTFGWRISIPWVCSFWITFAHATMTSELRLESYGGAMRAASQT